MADLSTRRTVLSLAGGGVPMLFVEPAGATRPPAVLFYHGLSADKDVHEREARSLAGAGLAAALPDAPHHGARRSPLLDEMRDATGLAAHRIFLRLLEEALAEVPALVDALLRRGHPAVAVAGISMGAYIALAAGAREPRLAAMLSILGSPDWTPRDGVVPPDLEAVVARAPVHHGERFPPRPLLLINGGRDESVPPGPARRFAEALRPRYAAWPERLLHREYPDAGHFPPENDWHDLWTTSVAFARRALEGAFEGPPLVAGRPAERPDELSTLSFRSSPTESGSGGARRHTPLADRLQTTLGVQRALTHLGFEPGPLDGAIGPRTRAAVAAFQAAHGLEARGLAVRETHAMLRRLVMRGFKPLGAMKSKRDGAMAS